MQSSDQDINDANVVRLSGDSTVAYVTLEGAKSCTADQHSTCRRALSYMSFLRNIMPKGQLAKG